jgi:glucosamine-phosphate N-acetyltransferase
MIRIEKTKREHMEAVLELLQHLSTFMPPNDLRDAIWESFIIQTNVYSIVALLKSEVVGYGAIVIEEKIRGGKMGHIEDIVSHPDYRGLGIGKRIVSSLSDFAKKEGCYKIALQCKAGNIVFYEKCGCEISGVAMQHFL